MAQKRVRTEVRKQQIISAARKLIVRHGSEQLTVRRLAKEVGFTEAALYRHFKSKREVLSFLMESVTDSMLIDLERSTEKELESADGIGKALRLHLSDIEQRKGMSFQIIAEIISYGDKDLNRSVYKKLQVYIDRLKQMLSEGARRGYIRKDIDLDACATLLFGMIQGLVNIWALNGYKFDLVSKYESLWPTFQLSIQPPPR
jgi:AcrR family transcriptional regulator